MKGLIVLWAALLVGCAEIKTLEELEFAALESGDWSAVAKRERNIEKRKRQRSFSCGSDAIAVCDERVRGTVCKCRSSQEVEDLLSSL